MDSLFGIRPRLPRFFERKLVLTSRLFLPRLGKSPHLCINIRVALHRRIGFVGGKLSVQAKTGLKRCGEAYWAGEVPQHHSKRRESSLLVYERTEIGGQWVTSASRRRTSRSPSPLIRPCFETSSLDVAENLAKAMRMDQRAMQGPVDSTFGRESFEKSVFCRLLLCTKILRRWCKEPWISQENGRCWRRTWQSKRRERDI